ncbi:MAG: hypothetical protein AAGM22_20840, partial [Acidobacteriota bacterium]
PRVDQRALGWEDPRNSRATELGFLLLAKPTQCEAQQHFEAFGVVPQRRGNGVDLCGGWAVVA